MDVKIIRSKRRKKTVQGSLQDGVLVVRAPERATQAELDRAVGALKARMERRLLTQAPSDELLERRARELNREHFGGALRWSSVRWVTNQHTQLGSCTSLDGTIRLSHRLAQMPPFVRDYVLMHELAHLLEPNHGSRFWELVNRFPRAERARGYLMAIGSEPLEE
ncbi:MAG: M48 family metallopeptidase [Chloroflexi bacterium]|nr:M48 family metallopeptidase [Chloroflexota bacterium]